MCWTLEDGMMTNALFKGLYEEWSCVEDEVQRRHEDGAQRGFPIMEYGGAFGEVFIKYVLASTIKKGVPT